MDGKKKKMIAQCLQLVEEADTAYLATLDADGFPHVRAMLNLRFADEYPSLAGFMQEHARGFETYFSTNASSQKIRQIRANSAGCVYYNIGYNGVTLTGTLEIVEDAALKNKLWQDGWELYYPKGKTDPDYAVLKFAPRRLRFFNNLSVNEIGLP